jgi:hypothetical protein
VGGVISHVPRVATVHLLLLDGICVVFVCTLVAPPMITHIHPALSYTYQLHWLLVRIRLFDVPVV